MDFRFWRLRRKVDSPEIEREESQPESLAISNAQSPFGRFIHSDDDARGHIAIALFLIQQFGENENLTVKQLVESISKTQPGFLQTVFFPASQRMLEKTFRELEDKEASREVQRSAIVAELTAVIEERHQYTAAQIDVLRDKADSSLVREIMKVTAATLITTIVVVLLSLLPEPIGSLKEGIQHLFK
jgi:hypothetical protein